MAMTDKPSTNLRGEESIGEQVVHSLTSGVIALDAEGVIIQANAAAAFLAADLPPGGRLEDLPLAEPFVAVFREAKAAQQPLTRREIILEPSDGAKKEIGLSVSLLQGPKAFNGVIFLFTDMTERRALERAAELNRQLAQIGALTAGVVHELRNPVSVISGMAELLMRKLGGGSDRYEIAETIFQEAQHLERSIAQFLGFARPFELEHGYCYPDAIAERALHLCERQAARKSVRLERVQEDGLPQMRADVSRAAQAVANLINNAIDAVPEGGHVRLAIQAKGDYVIFEVTDNGPGIHIGPDEDLFSPFFTKKESGTGLGLSIIHRIVTAHGGTVHYHNRDEGGACFQIRLPVNTTGTP